MAYESRIFIINLNRDIKTGKIYHVDHVATFNIGCMGYSNGWRELFDNKITYQIYAESDSYTTITDRYGEHLKSADFDKVINWLETKGQAMNHRRIAPLLGALKSFNRSEWEELQIVHYGY